MSIELMAPVKNSAGLVEALNSGADSVYLGFKEFNARCIAENFDVASMINAIKYVHKRHKKAYLTLNTLIKDSEIERAVKYAEIAVEAGIDAIIVQDIGVFTRLLDRGVPLIASTQMTICNRRGIEVAKKMGFSRVVLARELNIDELELIAQNAEGIELECFIHGGLCIGYSGQCNISSVFENAAANRGVCQTPCWEDYTLYCNNCVLDSGKLMKPKDMYGIDHIPLMRRIGITALKIQGRTRSLDYIRNVVSIYRKYINDSTSTNTINLSGDELELLRLQSPRGLMRGNLETCVNTSFVVESKCTPLPINEPDETYELAPCGTPKKIAAQFDDLSAINVKYLYRGLARIYLSLDSFIPENSLIIAELKLIAPIYMVMPTLIERYDIGYQEIENIVKTYNIDGISLSNIADLIYLEKINCEFSVERSFNICNKDTVNFLKNKGINSISLSFELTPAESIELSDKVDMIFERTVYGRPILMQMKYCLISKTNQCISNCRKCQKGDKYILSGRNSYLLSINPKRTETTLRPLKKLALPILEKDVEFVRFEFSDETTFQINSILGMYSSGYYPLGDYLNNVGSI